MEVVHLGVLFALVPLFGWGIGDFLIQRSTRDIGAHKTLFVTGVIGFVGLLPFVFSQLGSVSAMSFGLLALLSLLILVQALILFEALRIGKLSVIETALGFELPLTVGLAIFIGGESLSGVQTFLFLSTCVGIFLAANRSLGTKQRVFEKGVSLVLLSSCMSGLVNFYIGSFSESVGPLVTIWVTHSLLAVWCGLYMFYKREFRSLRTGISKHTAHVLGQGIADNVAWIGYASSAALLPISITATISESYIVLAALLGFFVGRERLSQFQMLGVLLTFASVLTLSLIS